MAEIDDKINVLESDYINNGKLKGLYIMNCITEKLTKIKLKLILNKLNF